MTYNERKVIIFLKYGSQAGLAKATAIDRPTLSRIMSGKREATAAQKKTIKKALAVGEEFFKNE